ncbi:unnamed protein product [Camellia sinensis]
MKLHHPLNPLLSQAELRISHHVFKLDDLLGWTALKIDPWGTMSNAIENISEALLSAIGFRKDGGTLSDVFKVDVVPRSRCYIDHIGWVHFSKAELETSVRTLGRDVVPTKVQTRRPLDLPLQDEDYTEDIKEVQAFLDKLWVKKIVRPGCSQEVLNVAVSSMSSLARILSAMSSKPKPRASL